jgi:hypothetical protein
MCEVDGKPDKHDMPEILENYRMETLKGRITWKN